MKKQSDKQERVIQALEKCVRKLREEKYFGKVTVVMQEGNVVHIQLNSDLTPVEFADKYHPRKLIIVRKKEQADLQKMMNEEIGRARGEDCGKQDEDKLEI